MLRPRSAVPDEAAFTNSVTGLQPSYHAVSTGVNLTTQFAYQLYVRIQQNNRPV